ncbi:hypothetical protein GCM10023350_20610 [Nocardioides endophyticus]|uniref:WD40 repeat domain-containing protein n=1 Tax=Nocardioides endophyticus TaxID=1353775 RepID=A0ABP8YSE3_9ACTN
MSTEERLGRTLHEHADGVDGRPLTLGDVRGRARQIRRRRAAAAAGGLALVAAVALPVALLSGAGGDSSDPDPAKPSPTRAVDPNTGVPTLQDGVIIYADGPRIPLPGELRQTADGFAVLGTDRYVVTSPAPDGEREATLVDEAGRQVDRFPLYSGITATPDGTSVAWIAPDRTLHLLVAGSDAPSIIALGDVRPTQTTAITGDCADVCTVAVRTARGGDLGGTVVVTSDGDVTTGPAGVPAVAAVSPNGSLIAGFDSVDEDGIHVCGGMYDVGVGDYVWDGCEHNVFQFSPDGALVATSFGEGLGPTAVRIRDARSGATIAELGGSRIASTAWEDATHLLVVVVEDDGSTSLQRIGLDGPPETVLDGFTTSGDDLSPPIILPFT